MLSRNHRTLNEAKSGILSFWKHNYTYSNISPEYMVKYTCLLTIAPIRLPQGGLWKYCSNSTSETFCTGPSTLTCTSKWTLKVFLRQEDCPAIYYHNAIIDQILFLIVSNLQFELNIVDS